MNTNETYYHDLISRYLSGEASQEEISELSLWIQSEPEHASLFNTLRMTWLSVVSDQVEQQMELGREWEALIPKLSGIRHPASGIRHPAPDNEPQIIPIDRERLPWQVFLIRASLIAAIALVLLIPSWIAYRYFTQTGIIRLTASNEVLNASLPDGSILSLNAFSSLTYTEDYGRTNRTIELNGQAYFEVNRDSLLPFVISCNDSRLEVLGTSFYVDARQEAGNMEVVLVDGSVAVYFEASRSTGKTIIPGEKAELIQADQRIIISPNEDPNFLAWKTHHLIFLDDRLDMIVNTLNKIYQADISLASDKLASCRLTATFDQQSLESVLSVIEVTLDLRSETTSSGIILYGKGCN